MKLEQQELFAQVVDRWYERSPACAAARTLDHAVLLSQHDEDELAFEDLAAILRMYAITITAEEYNILSEIIHGFSGELDAELLRDLAERIGPR